MGCVIFSLSPSRRVVRPLTWRWFNQCHPSSPTPSQANTWLGFHTSMASCFFQFSFGSRFLSAFLSVCIPKNKYTSMRSIQYRSRQHKSYSQYAALVEGHHRIYSIESSLDERDPVERTGKCDEGMSDFNPCCVTAFTLNHHCIHQKAGKPDPHPTRQRARGSARPTKRPRNGGQRRNEAPQLQAGV